MPCMSASGNISPQSMSRQPCRPARSTMQLRPISPRPPRKTMRDRCQPSAGQLERLDGRSRNAAAPPRRGRRGPRGPGPRPGGRGTHRQAALARPAGRGARSIALVGQRVRGVVAGLEGEALEQAGVDRAGAVDVALRPSRSNISWCVRRRPVGGHADHADRADGQQRQGHRVVAAVDLEAVGRLGDEPGRLARVAGGVLERRRCWAPRGPGAAASRWRSCGRCAPGCRRSSPAGRWPRRSPGSGPRCPACDGRL